jgi:type I restriction enzyme S subunit
MTRWRTKSLGDVLKVQNGYAFDSELFTEVPDGMPIIRIRDLARGFTETYFKGSYAEKFVINSGDLLIGMDGEFRCYKWPGPPALLNQRVCRLHTFNHDIHPSFIFYGINEHLTTIEANTGFSTVKHLSSRQIEEIKLPIPPLPEQERIVWILDEAQALRRLRTKADQRTTEGVAALFHAMFGDPIENQKRWSVIKVSDFVERLQAGRSVAPAGDESTSSTNRILKVSAVTWGQFSPNESKPVPEAYSPLNEHFVRSGDLLFSRANTTDLVGATVLVEATPGNLLLPDKLWRFIWKDPKTIEPKFILAVFQHPSMRRELGNQATGTGGSMKNISMDKLMALKIPWPPLAYQHEFASRIAELRALQKTQAASRQRLDDLFQSLLHRAFQGEL